VSGLTQTIVVVEDDASMSQAIERILRAGGYNVVVFDSAELALQGGAMTLPDCLVLDIRLPGISGFELYRRLIQYGSRVPVIFVTAHDDPALRKESENLGASSFLQKPFSGRVLLDAVTQALSTN
jgi:FixJ family two-component response regulator